MEWSLGSDQNDDFFYESIRRGIISLLTFIWLYSISYAIIKCLKKRRQCSTTDEEDDYVYRISLWLCCFTLTVSIGAVLLLPFSIVSNEILLRYPSSFYIKWLNDSLIHGLWNQIFLGTYVALFLAMPFAYFFTESEGFAGSSKGIKSRICETFVVLGLFGILSVSLVWVIYGIISNDIHSTIGSWLPHLPFLYSCISLFGVLLQLVCAPLGFSRLFSVLGEYVVKPKFLRDLDDEFQALQLQEDWTDRKINGFRKKDCLSTEESDYVQNFLQLKESKKVIESHRKASAWERNVLYPVCLLMLLALTAACLCMVALNCLSLFFMEGKLPLKTRYATLGKASFSFLGSYGSVIEIVLIFYVMVASLVGFYGMPVFQHLAPRKRRTGMTRLIANCIILLLLSSSLPILARTLGITRFDLMGEFGKLDWLGNFHLVLCYNLVFEVSTCLCLAKKFTSTVRQTLFERLKHNTAFARLFKTKLR